MKVKKFTVMANCSKDCLKNHIVKPRKGHHVLSQPPRHRPDSCLPRRHDARKSRPLRHRPNETSWELIIVNDRSPDDAGAIADRITLDNRIRVIHLAENGGKPNAMNVGTAAAKGRWVVCLMPMTGLTRSGCKAA